MTEFLRFVVDTNVLVSRLLAPRSTAARAVDPTAGSGPSSHGWDEEHGTHVRRSRAPVLDRQVVR